MEVTLSIANILQLCCLAAILALVLELTLAAILSTLSRRYKGKPLTEVKELVHYGGLIPRKSVYNDALKKANNDLWRRADKHLSWTTEQKSAWVMEQFNKRYKDLSILEDYFMGIYKEAIAIQQSPAVGDNIHGVLKKMRADGLLCKDYDSLVSVWHDIDDRCAVFLSGYVKLMKSQGALEDITDVRWESAVAISAMYYCRYNCKAYLYYSPETATEWKDMYFLASLIMCSSGGVFKKRSKKMEENIKVVHVKDKSSTETIKRLTAELSVANAQSRKMAQDTAAYYNKIIKQQAKRIEELQASTPAEAVQQVQGTQERLLFELPSYRVLWVGGHPTTTRKVSEMFPGWDVVEVNKLPDIYPDADICFVHTGYIGHAQFNHVRAHFKGAVLPCNGTNLDILHDELKSTYTSYVLNTRREEGQV